MERCPRCPVCSMALWGSSTLERPPVCTLLSWRSVYLMCCASCPTSQYLALSGCLFAAWLVWSQVRYSASVATRTFMQCVGPEQQDRFLPTLTGPMCLNRCVDATGGGTARTTLFAHTNMHLHAGVVSALLPAIIMTQPRHSL